MIKFKTENGIFSFEKRMEAREFAKKLIKTNTLALVSDSFRESSWFNIDSPRGKEYFGIKEK